MMSVCEELSGRLTAFLHRELPLTDSESIERHLSLCAECRAKLDKLHLVTRNLRKQVLTEPSARVRKQLQQRMENALRPAPKAPTKVAELPRLDAAREGWHIVATEPHALTLTPVPALPAPPALLPAPSSPGAPQSQSFPLAVDMSASRAPQDDNSARVSARQTARSARLTQDRERIRVLLCILLALLTALAGVLAWRQLHTPTVSAAHLPSRETAARQQRWQERVRVRDQDQLRQSFLSRDLKLPLEVSSSQLYLLPHHDASSGETFLALYREEDVEALGKDPTVDIVVFRAALETAQIVPFADGQIQFPAKVAGEQPLELYVGAEHRVAVMPMGFRFEIWSAPRLQRYLAGETTPPAKGLMAAQGLPPERP